MKDSKYNNSSFEGDVKQGKYDQNVDYKYFVEYDHEYEYYELSIHLNNEEIENYSYIEREEAERDIEQAGTDYDITFGRL